MATILYQGGLEVAIVNQIWNGYALETIRVKATA
jgi:hypothetical protein